MRLSTLVNRHEVDTYWAIVAESETYIVRQRSIDRVLE